MAIGDVLGEIVVDGKKYTFGDTERVGGKISCHGCLMPNDGNNTKCFHNHHGVSHYCFTMPISNGLIVNCQVVNIEDVADTEWKTEIEKIVNAD